MSQLFRRFFKNSSLSSQKLMQYEEHYGANNYKPLPVVISKASGVYVWDPEGNKYLDFLSSIGSVNQGHCHPRIVKAMEDQIKKLSLTSRAFYNDQFGTYAKFMTELFQYDKILPTNTGAESVDTAIKLSRKWGYLKKNIPENKAIILACSNNFHGRTLCATAMSTDPSAYSDFGPRLSNVGPVCPVTNNIIRYGNLEDVIKCFEQHHQHIAAFIIEPIQGEGGIILPPEGYLSKLNELCTKFNVLLIADEIQTGIGRTGKMLCIDHEDVRADIVLLGKSLSGGLYPVSCVLADDEILSVIKPGQHGSTFGGNPLACAVAMEAMKVVIDEKLVQNALEMGELLRQALRNLKSPVISDVRGRGLMNAIQIDSKYSAWDLCLEMKKFGILSRPTKNDIIRLAPPLVINSEQIKTGVEAISKSLEAIK
eukprot:NODE_33_length_32023_cov_0.217579.p7 type:complete len:425 gc:universal NODE_33_length_32023_cov_0.217579:20811-19537(-)